MNYEKAYKEALERAKMILCNIPEGSASVRDIETIFPELRESEDERIRKEIVSALKFANHGGVYDKHIAYLEKQKELPFVKDVMLGYPGLYFYDGERMHFQGNPATIDNPYDFAMSQQKEQKP